MADTLATIGRTHPAAFETVLPAHIARMAVQVPDDRVLNLGFYIAAENRIWGWLGEAGQARFLSKVENSSIAELLGAFAARHVQDVGARLLIRVMAAPLKDREEAMGRFPCAAFVGEALSHYRSLGSYRSAEVFGTNAVVPHAPFFKVEDIARLDSAIRGSPNNQILNAGGSSAILMQVFESTKHLLPAAAPHWASIAHYIINGRAAHNYEYPAFLAALTAAGVTVAPIPSVE